MFSCIFVAIVVHTVIYVIADLIISAIVSFARTIDALVAKLHFASYERRRTMEKAPWIERI